MRTARVRTAKPCPAVERAHRTKSRRPPSPLAIVALVRGEMLAAETAEASAGGSSKPPARGSTAKSKPTTRAGRKGFVLYVKPEVLLALRRLAFDLGLDPQKLGHQALTLLFREHNISLPEGALDAPAKA
jgi:hypothetical protein